MEDESYGSTREDPDELRKHATRMAMELWADPATKQGAIARSPSSSACIRRPCATGSDRPRGGARSGTTTAHTQRIAQLAPASK
jgi:hypothetical protein